MRLAGVVDVALAVDLGHGQNARCWWRSGSNCDGLFVNAWLVHDASYWQRRGSDWEGFDVVGNVMTGVIDVVMIKGADDVMAGMAV